MHQAFCDIGVMSDMPGTRIPLSEGYLVVDSRKCAGCIACMLACSLVHEGCANPSLARIQVEQASFAPYPVDTAIHVCR